MKRIAALLLVIMMLLGTALSGCARQDAAPQIAGLQTTAVQPVTLTGDEELEYRAVYGTAPDTIRSDSSVQASDGRYWQMSGRQENGMYIYYLASFSVEGGFFQRHPYNFEKNHSALIWSPVPGKPDTLWIIETTWNADTREYDTAHLKLLDETGKVLADRDVTNLDFNRESYSHPHLLADEKGVWLWLEGILYRFDNSGEKVYQLPLEQERNEPEFAFTASGQLAALTDNASGCFLRNLPRLTAGQRGNTDLALSGHCAAFGAETGTILYL